MIYLDNSATTKVLPEVANEMIKYLSEEYGNPSSKYYSLAENARKAVENARANIAQLLSCEKEEITFTSGATESNNMIIKGVADYYKDQGNHIITSRTEHSSVLEACKYLEQKGYQITYLDVDSYGRISLRDLKDSITDQTILVSLIWGNNELGSLNDMERISEICKEKQIFLHTDATQVLGKIKVNLKKYEGITFLSCSAHKMHGPKGIGVSFIRRDEYGILTPITPLLHGGEQDSYRSGTYAVHNIVGFGEAARIAYENLVINIDRLQKLENRLVEILENKFGKNISIHSDNKNKIPGLISVRFKGIQNQILLKKISKVIAASSGSACSTTKPSHVLKAIGLDDKAIQETIRFSMSPLIELKDIEIFNQL